ncbi:hypothetical protein AB5N19_02789 [Seiridium cardinale]|uniref:Uncharacterized protein n=1 Tax=Seiridium cardinale TaxID=138064 RepID=A0ABR2XGS6_9PEZI
MASQSADSTQSPLVSTPRPPTPTSTPPPPQQEPSVPDAQSCRSSSPEEPPSFDVLQATMDPTLPVPDPFSLDNGFFDPIAQAPVNPDPAWSFSNSPLWCNQAPFYSSYNVDPYVQTSFQAPTQLQSLQTRVVALETSLQNANQAIENLTTWSKGMEKHGEDLNKTSLHLFSLIQKPEFLRSALDEAK